jgi:uncharacterized protein YndB with AHSA1/START domain
MKKTRITVETIVKESIAKVWEYWTEPEHIMRWNQASDDWHTPAATNELVVGGKFSSTMAAKDGSMSFDFAGTYTEVDKHRKIAYVMSDGREVEVFFEDEQEGVRVTEVFVPEEMNTLELQQSGWQAILNSFRDYTEAN